MRDAKVAIAEAIRTDAAVLSLVPPSQVYAVERATLPTLPSIEILGVSSERVDSGPMVVHELSVEVTVSHSSEDGADSLLDSIVRAVRARLSAAETTDNPIALPTRETVVVALGGTRWSTSASAASGTVRGASVAASALVSQ